MAILDSTIKAGYYGVAGGKVAQHTYVLVEHPSGTYAMPCFGWFALYEGQYGSKNVVYPAELWTPYIVGSKLVGKSAAANLHVALGMAQFSLNPAYNWKLADWDKSNPSYAGLVSTSGIIYGVTGVCHQAANRVLLSIGRSPLDTSPMCWPPSFSATYWVYGWLGKDTPVALVMAQALFAQATARELPHQIRPMVSAQAQTELLQARQTEAVQAQMDRAMEPQERMKELRPLLAPLGEVKSEAYMANPQRLLEPDQQFQAFKQELDRMLLAGTISNQEYADKVNSAARDLFTELKNRLPADDYARLFPQFDPAVHSQIINPELMPQSYMPAREQLAVKL